jgi:hypothetical protein
MAHKRVVYTHISHQLHIPMPDQTPSVLSFDSSYFIIAVLRFLHLRLSILVPLIKAPWQIQILTSLFSSN